MFARERMGERTSEGEREKREREKERDEFNNIVYTLYLFVLSN